MQSVVEAGIGSFHFLCHPELSAQPNVTLLGLGFSRHVHMLSYCRDSSHRAPDSRAHHLWTSQLLLFKLLGLGQHVLTWSRGSFPSLHLSCWWPLLQVWVWTVSLDSRHTHVPASPLGGAGSSPAPPNEVSSLQPEVELLAELVGFVDRGKNCCGNIP